MIDYVERAEIVDNLIEEIYKNLLYLCAEGILDAHDVDVINSSIRSKWTDWALKVMDHEQYTQYILKLFKKMLDEEEEEFENDAPKGDLNARMYDVATHPYEEV